jgi:FMN phosphatase YigB (HAD superfamily)
MIHSILFDLDDTLLTTNLDTFLPGYFKLLSAKLSDLVPPKTFIEALMASTRLMTAPHSPALTNQQVFNGDFFARIGVPEATLRPLFDEFYRDDFPRLRSLTSPRPEARAVVQAAFHLFPHVAIATQPVFPLVAIRQRMDWAGVGDFAYQLVTGYENVHTSKPMREYYLEIASVLACSPDECLMVGNDRTQDIDPAHDAGMSTYWIVEGAEAGNPNGSLGTLSRLGEVLATLSHGAAG